MIKQGEITDIRNNIALVRVYKDGEPTTVTVNAKMKGDFSVADMVDLEINPFRFFIFSAFSYIFPFIAASLAYIISGIFTDNIVITEIVVLISLFASYLLAAFFEKSSLFEKLTVCTVFNMSEQ